MPLKAIALTASAPTLAAFAGPAFAEYPKKPVNFIVPWSPGDLEDVLTPMIAEDFQAEYGVPAAVVNKPGGGGGPFSDTLEELAAYAKENDVALAHYGEVVIPTKVTTALAKNGGYSYGADSAYDVIDCNTLASGDADVINTPTSLLRPGSPATLPCWKKSRPSLRKASGRALPCRAPDLADRAEFVGMVALGRCAGAGVHHTDARNRRGDDDLTCALAEVADLQWAEVNGRGLSRAAQIVERFKRADSP